MLYLGPKTIDELFVECSTMRKPQVITSLSNLLHNRAIKKEPIPEELPKVTDEFFDERPKRIKKKIRHRYVLVQAGLRKLAYLEWQYSLHTEWKCPWSDEYNTPYYDEMNRIIKNDLRLPVA